MDSLHVILQVVEDSQLVQGARHVRRVRAHGQLLQLQSSPL